MSGYQFNNILNFWFGEANSAEYGKPRQCWFVKDKQFDEEVRSRFFPIYQKAANDQLDEWKKSFLSCLALIIVLDQFPRNLFRQQPQAFATDNKALAVAEYAVKNEFDKQLLPVQRWFIYLPFEHSENLSHQQQAVTLFSSLKDDSDSTSTIQYACQHLAVIKRFGRFPHRNAILGRSNTPQEEEFLMQPGSSF